MSRTKTVTVNAEISMRLTIKDLSGCFALVGLLLAQVATAADKPNIVLILADDLGYSDLGCYGGEIHTPNIDSLAAGGVRFTQLYNSARCCPSRASLMTGLYPSQAGIGDFTTNKPSPTRGPGYLGRLNDHCATIAEVLEARRVRVLLRWQVAHASGDRPDQAWLRRVLWLHATIIRTISTMPTTTFDCREGRAKEIDPPADEFYATDVFNEYAIGVHSDRDSRATSRGFCFSAIRRRTFRCRLRRNEPTSTTKSYRRGWDVLREERFERHAGISV